MEDTKKVAVCVIFDELGRILLQRPSDYKNFGEYQMAWYPPTGHVKEGETVEQALVREAYEELNIIVKPIELISEWEQDIPGERAYWWKCKIVGGEMMNGEEIAEHRYFSFEDAKKVKMWPAEKKFFEKFYWKEK
jgi:mutator protein MutT